MKIKELLIENRVWNEDAAIQDLIGKAHDKIGYIPGFARITSKIAHELYRLLKKDPRSVMKITPEFFRNRSTNSEWDIKDAKAGTLELVDYRSLATEVDHILDYLAALEKENQLDLDNLRGYQSLDQLNQAADKYFAAKNKKVVDTEDTEGLELVKKYEDGFKWVKLKSGACLDREGKLMQHCVGSYAERVSSGKTIILSLRDPKNEPHITIELKGKNIEQIKGKQNAPPVKEYWSYVHDLIKSFNLKILYDYENIGLVKIKDKIISMEDAIKLLSKNKSLMKEYGGNLLTKAAKVGNTKEVQTLLAAGADVRTGNDTPLCIAADNGHAKTVKVLLTAGADVHTDDDWVLRCAASHGHTEMVKVLLASGADVHVRDDEALCFAADNGHTGAVKVLLAAGADVHADDDYALRWAAKKGHTETVNVLLVAGADVHADDDYALRCAASNGHTETVKVLLAAGANVHARDDNALHYASVYGHTETIKVLKDWMNKEKNESK